LTQPSRILALKTSSVVRSSAHALAAACAVACALGVAMGVSLSAQSSRPKATPARPPDAAVEELRQGLLADMALPSVSRAVWGVVVHSLDRDERLFELNPRTLLIPASVAKIVSAATAADAVGWDYTFATTVRATGPIVDGVLTGDLLVVGTGDPTPGGRAGDDLKVWADALKAAGLKRIEGRIIGDDDAIEEPRPANSWAWDDLGYVSGSLFGALNATENRMTVTIAPGATEGAPGALSVESFAQDRPLTNRTVTTRATAPFVWAEQRPGETALSIAGFVRPGAAPVPLSVSTGNPTLWFATLLREQLMRSGVAVTGRAMDVDELSAPPDLAASTLLYTHRSRPLSAIVRPMLKDSINLYGEALMRLNAAPGVLPTNDAALDGLHKRLAAWQIPEDGEQLVDGSGLSRRDLIAPETLYLMLKRLQDPAGTSPFVSALPIAGVDGSLVARMKGTAAEGNLRAKTGTMSNVRTLAGYVTTRDGEHLAFVIMANNYEGTGSAAVLVIDHMAVRLADFTRQR
jgi:D-alanyl-D-alanine carboxypeptidase/D-alanyl-D-alanine-endopeptidase (penicillin-binding protein 4)